MDSPTLSIRLGAWLIAIGIVGFVVAMLGHWAIGGTIPGEVPAISLFLVIVGLVFYLPDLLKDDTHATSTMRVVVLMITSVFVILTLKAGWTTNNLSDLKIDSSWAWVLAAALGGKVLQSFSESWTSTKTKDGAKGQK
jgi:hypothetical protein